MFKNREAKSQRGSWHHDRPPLTSLSLGLCTNYAFTPTITSMASTSSFFYRNPQTVLDDIDNQFQLSSPSLIELVKAFLAEFHVGLSSYNHPMAMMCVSSLIWDRSDTGSARRLSLVSQMAPRQGKQIKLSIAGRVTYRCI